MGPMDPNLPPNGSPLDGNSPLVATRYLTLIGCVLLIWDILLTLKDEVKYIWKLPVEFHKLVFLFNRYVVAGSMCFSVYILLELRGPLSEECILFITCSAIISITIANLTTVFHIQSLWEKRMGITYVLLVGFCITYGTTVICLGFVANDFQTHVRWAPGLNLCIIPHKPPLISGVWAGMVVFDMFVLGMVFMNAVNRPYRETSEVVHALQRDGVKFFSVHLTMSFINLLFSAFGSAKMMLTMVFFIWGITSTSLSRFLLMIKFSEDKLPSKEGRTSPTTTTILWRNNSGHWTRKSDMIELT